MQKAALFGAASCLLLIIQPFNPNGLLYFPQFNSAGDNILRRLATYYCCNLRELLPPDEDYFIAVSKDFLEI